jgi:hypothetical protein
MDRWRFCTTMLCRASVGDHRESDGADNFGLSLGERRPR